MTPVFSTLPFSPPGRQSDQNAHAESAKVTPKAFTPPELAADHSRQNSTQMRPHDPQIGRAPQRHRQCQPNQNTGHTSPKDHGFMQPRVRRILDHPAAIPVNPIPKEKRTGTSSEPTTKHPQSDFSFAR
jgi:hypothetical protein